MILDGEKSGASVIEFVENSNIKFANAVDAEKFYKILFDAIV